MTASSHSTPSPVAPSPVADFAALTTQVKFTVSGTLFVPEGTVSVVGAHGPCKLKLPDGTVLAVWAAFEGSSRSQPDERDLKYGDLSALGVLFDYDQCSLEPVTALPEQNLRDLERETA